MIFESDFVPQEKAHMCFFRGTTELENIIGLPDCVCLYYLFRSLQQLFPALIYAGLDVGDEVFFAGFEQMFKPSLRS